MVVSLLSLSSGSHALGSVATPPEFGARSPCAGPSGLTMRPSAITGCRWPLLPRCLAVTRGHRSAQYPC